MLKVLAIKPSSISLIKLMVINIAKSFSLFERISHRMKGKTSILYRDRILGIVQNLSAVVFKSKIYVLQFNSILFEE
jgi:hypothetical protein